MTAACTPRQRDARAVRTVVFQLTRKLRVTYRINPQRRVSRLLALLVAPFSSLVMALPAGLTVGAGQVTAQNPTAQSLVLNQGTQKAVLDWRSFNIAAGESVQFVQPGATSVALNRVNGADASAIFGSLSANGQIFLVNPAGVLFAPGAQVNAGAVVASTLALSNSDFLAGRYQFSGSGSGAVHNAGSITAAPGGYVLLAGPVVTNSGSISADHGAVGLAAGSRVAVDTSGAGLVRFSVDAAAVQAAVSNSGTITAAGGQVALLARSMGDAMATVVNQSGVIRADSAVEHNGMIVLSGGATGVTRLSGTLAAVVALMARDAGAHLPPVVARPFDRCRHAAQIRGPQAQHGSSSLRQVACCRSLISASFAGNWSGRQASRLPAAGALTGTPGTSVMFCHRP